MEIDRAALLPTFLGEAEDNLAVLESSLLELERSGADEQLVATLFRAAHTLKGNADSLGFDAMGACAHALENVLSAVREGSVRATQALVTELLGAHDALRAMLATIAAGGTPDARDHVATLDALERAALGTVDAGSGPPRTPLPGAATRARRTLRVDLQALDRIVTHTGELSIALERLRTVLSLVDATGQGLDALVEADRVFGDLRALAMRLRLVPIGPMFHAQARNVRDLAAAHGKAARLVVEGDDVEVDSAVVDELRDPITHMIRNAVDHAIEPQETRTRAGKDAVGTIVLRARHEAGRIVVELCDDGAGFDRERILARARERGMIAEGSRLDDDDVYRLVLEPGFSTASAVTDLSGRGVGMDVVARNVAALKGTLAIASRPGAGSTVTIRVPLTLAIIDGFAVGVAGETYVIPMDAVCECLALPRGTDSAPSAGSGVLELRGAPLPFLRLRDVFALPGAPPALESVVVVESEGTRVGLAVDALHGESEAVVKPLGEVLERADGVTGSTILGDGRVALIVDVPTILRNATRRGERAAKGEGA